MQVTLDLSPILVNRTAVYDICGEVDRIASARQSSQLDYQFVGRRMPHIPPADEQRELRRRLFRKVDEPGQSFAAPPQDATRVVRSDQDGRRIFYLDPLYTLFGTLGPDDVVMCHDLSPMTHPHWHRPNVSRHYDRAFSRIARSGCSIIAVSDNTAAALQVNLGLGARVRTVHNYLPKSVTRWKAGAHARPLAAAAPYLLFVGSLEVRKNIRGMIEAFRLTDLAARGYLLLIVGTHGYGAEEIEQTAARTEGVVLCGFLPGHEKLAAYAGATGFVYVSYLEGFGIPLLEAMAFGIPSVTTVTGACPEVGGPDVPCLDPDDHRGIADALRHIVGLSPTQRTRLGKRLRRRAEQEFSLDRFSRNMEEVLFG